MAKIKKLFNTPKKATITIVCMLVILSAMGAGTVYVASTIAESSSIGAENARNFAFADAGVDPVDARIIKTEFDFEQGQFVYEVKFIVGSIEYEYLIKASNGSVLKKEMEIVSDGANTTIEASITHEEAKEIALDDAGVTISEVTFTKEKLDYEDGILVYEIEFYLGNTEYEYEINANTGAVYSKSKETHAVNNAQTTTGSEKPDNNNYLSDLAQISSDEAKNKALTDAGVSSTDVTYTKTKLDYEDGITVYEIEFYTSTHEYEYEINANTGAVYKKSVEVLKNNTGNNNDNGNTNGDYIGIDKAKSIALSHAGFSASEVDFSKAKLDKDDGFVIYEIEFYKNGVEYEYEINAITGDILKYDWD
ncbi:MAG: PepSY domain-containing protein [Lachnospiraceae bacterium]|nr:PepSY domain-containing protein [Lachnospiraceae bacterium]MDE6697902.1 PepSY domain-containing protein [Lachnospiraceae bacterium]